MASRVWKSTKIFLSTQKMTICFFLSRCSDYSRKNTKKFWPRISGSEQDSCYKHSPDSLRTYYHRTLLWAIEPPSKLYISVSFSSWVYHILYKFCSYFMSIYLRNTHSFRRCCRISWLEHCCDHHHDAFYNPCI